MKDLVTNVNTKLMDNISSFSHVIVGDSGPPELPGSRSADFPEFLGHTCEPIRCSGFVTRGPSYCLEELYTALVILYFHFLWSCVVLLNDKGDLQTLVFRFELV